MMTENSNSLASAKFERRTEQYISLRAKIAEITERHRQELAPFIETQNLLTAWFTQNLELVGAQSVKTANGTVYQSTTYTASLEDPKAFMDFVITNEKYELLNKSANATAVRDFVKETGGLPPGAKLNAKRTIGVRRPT